VIFNNVLRTNVKNKIKDNLCDTEYLGKSSVKKSSIYEWNTIFKTILRVMLSTRDVDLDVPTRQGLMIFMICETIRFLPKLRSSHALTSGVIDGRSVYRVVENISKSFKFPDAVSHQEISCPAQRNPTLQ
jgi:hypothetical protein